MGKIGVDSPITTLISFGQSRLLCRMAETRVIQLATLSIEADCDIAQAFPMGKLSECHNQKLIPASKSTDTFISVVSLNTAIEFIMRNVLHNLRKDCSSLIHCYSPFGRQMG